MFTQITIIKVDEKDDVYKLTFFNDDGVVYSENIAGYTEVFASLKCAIPCVHPSPRSAYAKS
jgi:hypothetical protein